MVKPTRSREQDLRALCVWMAKCGGLCPLKDIVSRFPGWEELVSEAAAQSLVDASFDDLCLLTEGEFLADIPAGTQRFAVVSPDLSEVNARGIKAVYGTPSARDMFEIVVGTRNYCRGGSGEFLVLDDLPSNCDRFVDGHSTWGSWFDVRAFLLTSACQYLRDLVGAGELDSADLRLRHELYGAMPAAWSPVTNSPCFSVDSLLVDIELVGAFEVLGMLDGSLPEQILMAYREGFFPCGLTRRYPLLGPIEVVPFPDGVGAGTH